MKKSLFILVAAFGLSLSAPVLANDGENADHAEAVDNGGKNDEGAPVMKGKKEAKKGKHHGHHHGEKNEKAAGGEKK